MAASRRPPITEKDLQGLKYFKVLGSLLERLHGHACERDKAGNRKLHYDQYGLLILLSYFNPIITGLRSIQQASTLAKVQKLLGCERAALGSLSEASRVFDAELLSGVIAELAEKALPIMHGREAEALRGLTAVDGSLLPALPKMAWALWQDDRHRAAKMHVHFDVLKGVPCHVSVTAGNDSERVELRKKLEPNRLYVVDSGYVSYQLYQDIIDHDSSVIGRLRDESVYEVIEERPLSAAAQAAGVTRDILVHLGSAQRGKVLQQPLRLVFVATGKIRPDGTAEILILVTNRLDLDADLVALAYRYRWSVELFFRWFKCILGCRHLLSTDRNGVTIQVYLGIIASLLISLWTGKKPTRRTFEMLLLYFAGWASEAELFVHLDRLSPHAD